MGWFSKEQPPVVHTAERRRCWETRDQFFKCLDAHSIVDARKEDSRARKACPDEIRQFESACIDTWVDYFKQKRVVDAAKQLRIKELEAMGYQPLDRPLDVKPR